MYLIAGGIGHAAVARQVGDQAVLQPLSLIFPEEGGNIQHIVIDLHARNAALEAAVGVGRAADGQVVAGCVGVANRAGACDG